MRPVAPFVTAFMAQMNCDRGMLTYCNAGHFPPILLRANGLAESLETGGPLLGAIEDAGFESGETNFHPGDTLVAYSDGVLECRNPSGEEFGSSRLLAAVQQAKQATAQATLVTLLAAVQDFANGGPLCDDVSLIVIQRDLNR
jgi:sigma-B regulation protein RsbU (phosphoserine phosphatase)